MSLTYVGFAAEVFAGSLMSLGGWEVERDWGGEGNVSKSRKHKLER